MDPSTPNSPFDPNRQQYPPAEPATYGSQPSLQPRVVAGTNDILPRPSKKGPNKLIIIIIAGVVLLLILGIYAITATQSQKTAAPQSNQQSAETDYAQSLQPAQAIDLEQANNAISQDLSSLDDEKDFPAASLDDKTLGL